MHEVGVRAWLACGKEGLWDGRVMDGRGRWTSGDGFERPQHRGDTTFNGTYNLNPPLQEELIDNKHEWIVFSVS